MRTPPGWFCCAAFLCFAYQGHSLHVGEVGEHIDALYLDGPVAAFGEYSEDLLPKIPAGRRLRPTEAALRLSVSAGLWDGCRCGAGQG